MAKYNNIYATVARHNEEIVRHVGSGDGNGLNRSIRVNNENSIAGLSNVKQAESDNSANSRTPRDANKAA